MYRYIGNKAKLTPYILDKVQQMIGDTGTVADIMAGTGTVSLELRKKGYKVVASDVMTYSYHHLNVNLCMKKPPEFLGLKDIITDDSQCMYESVLKYLNCIEPKKSFFYREFSPEGTPRNGTPSRKYFTSENAMRIDAIREKINEWIDDKLINKSESCPCCKNKRLFDADPEETVGIIKIKCPMCKSVIAVSFRNQKVRTERIAAR